jgi:hypothetical protein
VSEGATPWESPPPKIDGCDSCGYEPVAVKAYHRAANVEHDWRQGLLDDAYPDGAYPWKWLCELCANTATPLFLDYRHRMTPESDVMRTVCYVGNRILAELRATPSAQPSVPNPADAARETKP